MRYVYDRNKAILLSEAGVLLEYNNDSAEVSSVGLVRLKEIIIENTYVVQQISEIITSLINEVVMRSRGNLASAERLLQENIASNERIDFTGGINTLFIHQ